MLRILFFSVLVLSSTVYAEVKNYELTVTKAGYNISGIQHPNKILVNGSIPAPILEFTIGDTARIKVINRTKEETLIHWHGILLPNDQDGVPFISSDPIPAGKSKTYEFELIQTGTYWYHSHVMFQEQDGLYGAFIIHPKDRSKIEERTVLLSDFSKESGEQIMTNLKKDGEYYAVQKDTVQSWLKSIITGTAGTKMRNSLQRMGGMDYADVAYDAFLANGSEKLTLFHSPEKKRVKLRIINGSATTIFKVTYGGDFIEVVETDGQPVTPIKVKELQISVAETYDIILSTNENESIELRATSIDNSGFSQIFIGEGKSLLAPDASYQNPISISMGEMMGMNDMGFFSELMMNYKNEWSDFPSLEKAKVSIYRAPTEMELNPMHGMMGEMVMDHSSHSKMKMDEVFDTLEYENLRSPKGLIKIPTDKPLRTINFTLDGNMENYFWSINGKPLGPETYLKIKKGERVRFVMRNTTMMNHPMHLHGHFFRVMTKQGEYSVVKHTVNVTPMGNTVLEFDADEEKDWFFHCHLLYHMMGGMARIVRYQDNPGDLEIEKKRIESHEFNYAKKFFLRSKNIFQSSYSRTETSFFNSYYDINLDLLSKSRSDGEGEIHVSKIMTRYLNLYVGAKGEVEEGEENYSPTLGFTWVIPFNINVDAKYQPEFEKKFEFELETEIQLTDKLQLNYELSSIRNFYSELEYRTNKNLSLLMSYNETYKQWGLGLGYTY